MTTSVFLSEQDQVEHHRREAELDELKRVNRFGFFLGTIARQNGLEVEDLDPQTVAYYWKGWR